MSSAPTIVRDKIAWWMERAILARFNPMMGFCMNKGGIQYLIEPRQYLSRADGVADLSRLCRRSKLAQKLLLLLRRRSCFHRAPRRLQRCLELEWRRGMQWWERETLLRRRLELVLEEEEVVGHGVVALRRRREMWLVLMVGKGGERHEEGGRRRRLVLVEE